MALAGLEATKADSLDDSLLFFTLRCSSKTAAKFAALYFSERMFVKSSGSRHAEMASLMRRTASYRRLSACTCPLRLVLRA